MDWIRCWLGRRSVSFSCMETPMSVARSSRISILRRLAHAGALVAALVAASAPAVSQTRFEERAAAAAGAAAARAADRAVQHAVLHGAVRYRWPACRAGAREFRLRGFKHLIFMRECMRLL
jgi:hypothetical protein